MNLTPTAVGAVALIALIGIIGEWSEALGGYPWWQLAATVFVIGLGYEAWRVRKTRITAQWSGGDHLRLGQPSALYLQLGNTSARPVRVQCVPVYPAALSAEQHHADDRIQQLLLPANATASMTTTARPILLDEHSWPPVRARILGSFGLAWWSRSVETHQTLQVGPDQLGPNTRGAGSATTGGAASRSRGTGLEVDRLRPYRPGDPRRAIDWKATARTGKLITREFSEDQHLEIVIAIDAGRTSHVEIDGMSQLGHYVNLAARFAEHCMSGDDLVGVMAFADKPLVTVLPARGLAAVRHLRQSLSRLASQSVESDPLEAAIHIRQWVHRRCLVILLTDLYESSSGDRLAAAVKFLSPPHLPIVAGLASHELAELAHAEAQDWLDPYHSLAAELHEKRMQAGLQRLQHLGAVTLMAHPAELDRKALERYQLLRTQRRI